MKLRINGQVADIPQDQTVADCLSALNLDPEAVVVERNEAIVPKDRWADTLLAEGDSLEIVSFVGGG